MNGISRSTAKDYKQKKIGDFGGDEIVENQYDSEGLTFESF